MLLYQYCVLSDVDEEDVWLPIPGWYGYEVSDQGDVYSLKSERLLRQRLHSRDGYCMVNLYGDEGRSTVTVHTLVLGAFVGPRPEGYVCRHLNGVAQDNRLTNLKWGTPEENAQDALDHGTHARASATHCHRGHPFDESNTYQHPNGQRVCRECKRISNHGYRKRKEACYVRGCDAVHELW